MKKQPKSEPILAGCSATPDSDLVTLVREFEQNEREGTTINGLIVQRETEIDELRRNTELTIKQLKLRVEDDNLWLEEIKQRQHTLHTLIARQTPTPVPQFWA